MHLCRGCRHRATSHDGGDRGYSGCRCCRGPGDLDQEPVLVPTSSIPGGRPEPLYRPGTVWNAGTMHKLVLCDCSRCQARYAELVGRESPSTRTVTSRAGDADGSASLTRSGQAAPLR
jgi:hypothetical protein